MVYTQDVIPLLEEGTVWHVYHKSIEGGGYVYPLEIVETVDINGILYKRFEGYCDAFFREDNGLIYQADVDGNEQLMYNFNLDVGDTFTFSDISALFCEISAYSGEEFEVTEVTTQFIAGLDRKVMILEGVQGKETWIEGIGAVSSLDTHAWFIAFYNRLICHTKDGITTFFNGFDECEATAGLDDFFKSTVVLAPNPVFSISTLQFSSEGAADTVHILDVFGRVISEINVQGDRVLIDAKAYSAGVYFYQVYSEKQLLKTEKFIVK